MFLVTTALALLGIALAAAAVRAALADGRTLPSFGRTVAVTAVAVTAATGLANAGDSLRWLVDRREQWSPVSEDVAIEKTSVAAGIDPAFIDFAKGHLLRGDSYFLSHNAGAETRMWLNFVLAPNLAEDKLADADWLIYWQERDPLKRHRVRPDQVVTHLEWGPDVGLIRVRRDES